MLNIFFANYLKFLLAKEVFEPNSMNAFITDAACLCGICQFIKYLKYKSHRLKAINTGTISFKFAILEISISITQQYNAYFGSKALMEKSVRKRYIISNNINSPKH